MGNSRENYKQRAEFYDLEFNDKSDQRIMKSLIAPHVNMILEIPCGSGRNCDWLLNTGREVVFADISEDMVGLVASKLAAFPEKHMGHAICADMTKFKWKNKFDLILIPREAIQMLSRRNMAKCLSVLKDNLSDRGVMYVDFAVLNTKLVAKPENLPSYIALQGSRFINDIDYSSQEINYKRWHRSKLKDNKLYTDFRYEANTGDKCRHYKSSIVLENYDYEYLLNLFQKKGFNVSKVYGGYKKEKYSSVSERMIFILKP